MSIIIEERSRFERSVPVDDGKSEDPNLQGFGKTWMSGRDSRLAGLLSKQMNLFSRRAHHNIWGYASLSEIPLRRQLLQLLPHLLWLEQGAEALEDFQGLGERAPVRKRFFPRFSPPHWEC